MTAVAVGFSSCKDDDSEPGPGPVGGDPSLTLTGGEVSDVSIKFTIVPENAEKVAYMVLEEGAEVPDAETIMSRGKKGTATKERTYTEQGLTAQTTYVVVAAASNGEKFSEVEQISITTSEKVYVPTITLTEESTLISLAVFTIEVKDADKAAYVCVKKGATLPDAAGILKDGASVSISEAQTIKLSGLEGNTEYIVAAAASHGETLSDVKQLAIKTVTGGISNELKALVGEWTASMKMRTTTADGYVTANTTDVTFPVTITTGVNDWTNDWYAINNVLMCKGFMDMSDYSIDYLMNNKGFSELEASLYCGPKWFITYLSDERTFLVPNGYNVYDKTGSDVFNSGYVEAQGGDEYISYVFARSIGGGKEGGDVGGPSSFEVEVSADGNTITVKSYADESNPQIVYYPSFCSFDRETRTQATFWGAYKNGCTLGGSDIVLTRKSSGVAPMSVSTDGVIGSLPSCALESVVSYQTMQTKAASYRR